MTTIEELFSRGVSSCIDPNSVFRKKIEAKIAGTYTGEIIIKLGVDPTRPDIHIGHAVILRKLRQFQDIGCKVVFLIGDYTTQIGDPTGKSKVRPEISQAEIEANMHTYLAQVGKVLKTTPDVFSWIRNSDWFLNVTDIEPSAKARMTFNSVIINPSSFVGKAIIFEETRMQKAALKRSNIQTVSLSRVLSTLRHITHARLIERDMFQDRLNSNSELYMHEMLYPILQGIDSSIIATIYGSCDLEIGGTDQHFNMLIGRDVMKMNKQPEQAVMSLDILEGLDGKEKMSKSLDNYVGITDEPNDMFGKIMSIPDNLIPRYFTLSAYTPLSEVQEITEGLQKGTLHPRDTKMRLAKEITAIYHGTALADKAQEAFVSTFSKGNIPDKVPEVVLAPEATAIDALITAECVTSRAEGRRLIEAGGLRNLDTDTKISHPNISLPRGTYRAGKHRFFKVVYV